MEKNKKGCKFRNSMYDLVEYTAKHSGLVPQINANKNIYLFFYADDELRATCNYFDTHLEEYEYSEAIDDPIKLENQKFIVAFYAGKKEFYTNTNFDYCNEYIFAGAKTKENVELVKRQNMENRKKDGPLCYNKQNVDVMTSLFEDLHSDYKKTKKFPFENSTMSKFLNGKKSILDELFAFCEKLNNELETEMKKDVKNSKSIERKDYYASRMEQIKNLKKCAKTLLNDYLELAKREQKQADHELTETETN